MSYDFEKGFKGILCIVIIKEPLRVINIGMVDDTNPA